MRLRWCLISSCIGATLSITSKSFSPSQFLSTAYPNATYHDLVLGAENLQRSLDEREESVMNLVEDNLDSFVSVKSAMDSKFLENRIIMT